MIISYLLLSLFLFGKGEECSHNFHANNTEKVYLEWKKGSPLSWRNFRHKKNVKSNISALTASAIEYSYECCGSDMKSSVRAVFIPEDSWVNVKNKNDYILAHEQLHFDITELYARKFRMLLDNYKLGCNDVRIFNRLADSINDEWRKVQMQYDAETNHSLNKSDQIKWDKKIKIELEKLKAYAL